MTEPKPKGPQWRKGYQRGCDEGYQRGCDKTAKAYGGCESCYGKGYSTQLIREHEGGESKTIMNYCICDRGDQLCLLFATLSMPHVGEICGVNMHVDTKDLFKVKEVMDELDKKFGVTE